MIFDYIQTTAEQKDILDIARQICEKELLPQVPVKQSLLQKQGTLT